jgi:diacylglycerol kinase (CTP)
VKNITRKVIKRLEGLGHLEMVDALYELDGEADTESDAMDEQDNEEVEKVLRNHFPKAVNGAQTNGHPTLKQQTVESVVPQKEKIDWEIPRKLLHGSIGMLYSHCRKPLSDTFTQDS